jgi:two-component system response regulator MtrA
VTPRILLVEDDRRLGEQVAASLRGAGHEVAWLLDGDAAMRADPSAYDLVVLDVMLPGAHGLEVLRRLRRTSALPVLVLSAVQATPEKVRALSLGADDFVTKPFWPEELLARVAARLRRPSLARDGRVTVGPLAIDLEARTVEAAGQPVDLTRVEFDLLAALARRPGAAVSRAWLVDHVLDPDRDGTERTLDVHVSRIRRKLGAAARVLETVWGVGYRLEGRGAP